MTVFMLIFGALSGRLSDRFGAKQMLFIGAVLTVVGYATLAFADNERWENYTAMAVVAVALGLGFAAMSSLIAIAVPPCQTGAATGMNANIRTLGGSIGAAVTATIATAGVAARGIPTVSGHRNGFAVIAGIGVLASLAVLILPVKRHASGDVEQPHAELALVCAGTLAGSEPE